MRLLILDTETTGLDAGLGHRIIELAAVEIIHRRPTGRHLHVYLDPEREIDAGATEVHGMTWDDLKGKPKFRDVVPEFLDFAGGAKWIIHNAAFDVGFLDREFAQAGFPGCAMVHRGIIDTLEMSRDAFPGKRHNLSALCERFGISNVQRSLHGALLDAQLLAEVYLAMTRGQESLTIDLGARATGADTIAQAAWGGSGAHRPHLVVIAPTAEELAAHHAYLEILDRESSSGCVWWKLAQSSSYGAPGNT
ncbi:MAG: DNA polymerase III subunit epsilon [Betaproteobacteria bacterium]|nr:DNA polymerase III subunit epsilon [Betaproteobacteria bacterium]